MSVGKHIIVDMFQIPEIAFSNVLSKNNVSVFFDTVEALLIENKMTVLGKNVHHFDSQLEGAITLLYLLAESHLSMHTWPENNYISLDCYTCGECNTQNVVDGIIKLFKPLKVTQKYIERRASNKVVCSTLLLEGDEYVTSRDIENDLHVFSTNYKNHKIIDEKQTDYQRIMITENDKLGKCLFIDDALQVCENDIDAYNVAMSCDMMKHLKKKDLQLLVLGGGDGFLVEHLLDKYDSVIQSIVVVELDVDVTRMTNKHFRYGRNWQEMSTKITYINDFGDKYIQTTNKTFDGIMIDCTDYNPKSPSAGLFSNEFYKQCYNALNPNGYITQQYSEVTKMLDNKGVVCYPTIDTQCKYHFSQSYIFSYGVPLVCLHMTK